MKLNFEDIKEICKKNFISGTSLSINNKSFLQMECMEKVLCIASHLTNKSKLS